MQNRIFKKRFFRTVSVTVLCLLCCLTVISAMVPENGAGGMLPGHENIAGADNGTNRQSNGSTAPGRTQNGMEKSGNAARDIGDAAREAVSDAGNTAGNLIEGAGNAVDDAAGSVGNAINSTGNAGINDNAGTAGSSGSVSNTDAGGVNWILVLVLVIAAAAVFILLLSPRKSRS